MKNLLHQFITLLILLALMAPSQAVPLFLTDRSAFDSEVSNFSNPDVRILDFDSSSPGDRIPSGSTLLFTPDPGGVEFNYLIGDGLGGFLEMIVDDQFDTTSGNNYLGLDDPGNFNQFIAGDAFNLRLRGPFNALGLSFITSDPLLAGDILLQTGLGTVENSAIEETILGDGGVVYFLGLVSTDATFGSAQIRFDPLATGTFLYNADDIVAAKIPEPGTVMLVLIGLLGLLLRNQLC